MNLNFRRTALLVGICSAVSLAYTPQLFAASVDAIDAVQQAKKITGTVTDAMGPVIGANVLEKGTTNGVITDIDGNFTLNVQPGATIVVSFIGYQPQEIVVGNQTSFKIQLKEDTELLDEVVVVGYGVQKKKLVTGATVEVKGEDIAKLNTTQALGALQSQSPGVNIQAVSGQPGDGFKINIRGAGTNGNTAPVYVIDGVAGGDINALNPADIERIDVLKDAASCAIYGSSGANGVILITTKQGKVGKVSVSYDGNIGWANIYKMPDMLNAKEYMAVMDQVAYNNGGQPYDWSKFVDADLLPADVIGTMVYSQKDETFQVKKGPVFANFVLADEINRAPAKVQSALLEAMQERQVTIGNETFGLPKPFLVLATQNPIEQEGTYPLPEAQVDRFMLKVVIDYPKLEEEKLIIRQNINGDKFEVKPILKADEIIEARKVVRQVYLDEKIEKYIVDIVFATRYPEKYDLKELKDMIGFGGSPRASINLALAARSYAFIKRRGYVIPEDVRAVAHDVLRHRIGLTYEAEASNMTSDEIVSKILNKVEVP